MRRQIAGDVLKTGKWSEQDLDLAACDYKSAADQNDPVGQQLFGLCLLNGWGVEED
jgi:TPR repeat protein